MFRQRDEEIKTVFLDYLKVYFAERDLTKTMKMLSKTTTGYGTGFGEKSYDIENTLSLFVRDIRNVPNPIHYTINKLHIQSPIDNVGIVCCELDLETDVLNHKMVLKNIRFSSVWIKYDDNWLLENMHLSFPTEIHGEDECYPIKEIEEQNIVLQRLLEERTHELKAALQKISTLAITDKLTQIYNRLKIEESLSNEIERARRYNSIFSIILIDIDHFKRVNDEHGHIVGDKVLVEFAKILSNRIRKTDICGRWGGEEFILICPHTNLEEAFNIAKDLQKTIIQYNFFSVGKITASFGISTFSHDDTSDSLIKRADDALYQAKNGGRNRIVLQDS
ncbi:MAG: diguanylate cyclase [Thermodesulfovibrionales bacterium]|nr:diguanylate cyclase [Thermodesulfovibrionales bacterium]